MFDTLLDHFLSQRPAGQQRAHPTSTIEEKHASQISNLTDLTLDPKEAVHPSASEWKPTNKEWAIMVTMAVSSLVVALDATILVPVLPTLAVDLQGTSTEAFWTGTSYLLAHAVLQPLIASLSEIFGRRELLIPSISFFILGSIVCAVAHSFPVMLTGRVLQGFGGAGIITLSQIVFADLVPLRLRPKYFTMVLGAWAFGSVMGPLIGGVFVQKATWRGCFWLNLPICGVALLMAICFMGHLQKVNKAGLVTNLRSVDYFGNILFIAALTAVLMSISWAGIQYSWISTAVLIPLILGIVILIATIFFECSTSSLAPSNPFLPKQLFTTASSIASYTIALLQGLTLYMALYYLAFYFSSIRFYSPIRSGTSILPATVLLLPGSAIISALASRTGHFRWAIWIGLAISTLSAGLIIAFLNAHTRTAIWATLIALFGLGMGMILSAVNVSIQAIVPIELTGQASVYYAFFRSVGMTIGVAVGGTVFQNVMKHRLINHSHVDPARAADLARHAEGFIPTLRAMAEGPMREAIIDGYAWGFRGVWITMTAVCGVGLLISVLVKRGDLNKTLSSEHTTRRQEEV